jgi:hypothetical protein
MQYGLHLDKHLSIAPHCPNIGMTVRVYFLNAPSDPHQHMREQSLHWIAELAITAFSSELLEDSRYATVTAVQL